MATSVFIWIFLIQSFLTLSLQSYLAIFRSRIASVHEKQVASMGSSESSQATLYCLLAAVVSISVVIAVIGTYLAIHNSITGSFRVGNRRLRELPRDSHPVPEHWPGGGFCGGCRRSQGPMEGFHILEQPWGRGERVGRPFHPPRGIHAQEPRSRERGYRDRSSNEGERPKGKREIHIHNNATSKNQIRVRTRNGITRSGKRSTHESPQPRGSLPDYQVPQWNNPEEEGSTTSGWRSIRSRSNSDRGSLGNWPGEDLDT